jgi:hypothetical protein
MCAPTWHVVAYVFCAARAFAVQHNIRARKYGTCMAADKKKEQELGQELVRNWSGTGQELVNNHVLGTGQELAGTCQELAGTDRNLPEHEARNRMRSRNWSGTGQELVKAGPLGREAWGWVLAVVAPSPQTLPPWPLVSMGIGRVDITVVSIWLSRPKVS